MMADLIAESTTAADALSAREQIGELELRLEKIRQDRDDIAYMGAMLAAITNLEEILSVLMQMSLRVIGAEVGLILAAESGEPKLVPKVVWGFDPRAVPVLKYDQNTNVVEWVMRQGEGVVVDYSASESGLEFDGQRLMVGGVIALPIKAQDEIVGCVLVVNKNTGGPFTEDDRDLLQMLVNFAGVAIEHTRLLAESLDKQRMEQELALAEEIQQTLVPTIDLKFPGVRIKALYQPAREVGGDYFDLIPQGDDKFVLVTGDVSNKGVPAALLMTAVRSIVRSEVARSASTAEVVARINDLVATDLTSDQDMFVTFFLASFDLSVGVVDFTNAGHPPPLYYCAAEDRLIELATGGVFLGQFPGAQYTSGRQKLAEGDRIITFTDGIIEAADAQGCLYGRDGLKRFTMQNKSLAAESFLEKLAADLQANYNNADYIDDVTVVLLEIDQLGGGRR